MAKVLMSETVDFFIDTNFPGSNIIVEKVIGDDVYLRQDRRDSGTWWFYWAFHVSCPSKRRLRFHFTDGDVLGVRGPAISIDDGMSWEWLGEESVLRDNGNVSFFFDFHSSAAKIRLAFCPLYTQRHLDDFLSHHNPHLLKRSLFCHSRAGRKVELLETGSAAAPTRILLICRHHACETMASYCLEGILEAALGEDELGLWLRENVSIAAVPFMDKDGVEQGDQGKNRLPHDHNRDYSGAVSHSIYPEVKALREWVASWLEPDKSTFVFDLHCPWIRGGRNEEVYFVGGENQDIWQRVMEFSSVLQDVQNGAIPFRAVNNLPYGCEWNTGANYGTGKSCSKWTDSLPDIHLVSGLEIPYANDVPMTPQNARELGRDLARALQQYLMREEKWNSFSAQAGERVGGDGVNLRKNGRMS
jgi:hypothetical protein